MKDIVIYGAGGFGREVACLINEINSNTPEWNLLGFIDDGVPHGYSNEYGEVLGGVEYLNSRKATINLVFGIGSQNTVKALYKKIDNPNIEFPNLFSPSLHWLDKSNFKAGMGNVICAQGFVSCNVKIGNFNIINNGVSLGHDCRIGDFNALMPGAHVSGGVEIGNLNFMGVNSSILPYFKIADEVTVGAGSVVMRNIKKSGTYVGVPAQKLML